MPTRRSFLAGAAISPLFLSSARSTASQWPTRPIKIVVPFGPGGSADVVARYVSKTLQERLGQSIVIENRTGAAGTIGTGSVARSEPDGYTLLAISNTITANETLISSRTYSLTRDLRPIALFNVAYNALVVPSTSPFNSVSALIEMARAKPGALNYATSGLGSVYHIIGENFRSSAGIEVQHIPFRSSDQARTAILSGTVDYMFDAIPTMIESIRGDQVKALGTTGPTRDSLLPQIPAVCEELTGFTGAIWIGLLAPAGIPDEIVERLNSEINSIVNTEPSLTWHSKLGFHPSSISAREFAQFLERDIEQNRKLILAAGIKAEP